MSPETAFTIINTGILPAWLLLALAPRWQVTMTLIHGGWYIAAYCVIYVAVLIYAIGFTPGVEGAGFDSLEAVSLLFSTQLGVLIGWVHFLAFDLFVGAWIARDGHRRGLSHWLLLPCLALSFLFGPAGLLAYLILRLVRIRRFSGLQEVAS